MGDERSLRNELSALIEDKILDAFDPRQPSTAFSKMTQRIEVLEKAYDQCVKSITLLDGKIDVEADKTFKIEDTLRD